MEMNLGLGKGLRGIKRYFDADLFEVSWLPFILAFSSTYFFLRVTLSETIIFGGVFLLVFQALLFFPLLVSLKQTHKHLVWASPIPTLFFASMVVKAEMAQRDLSLIEGIILGVFIVAVLIYTSTFVFSPVSKKDKKETFITSH